MFNEHFCRKILKIIIICIVIFPVYNLKSQIYLTEGFEIGAKPDSWTEEFVSGTEPWRYRNGGHSPNDNNWSVPAAQLDITRNPPSAYEGTYNAIFFKQGDDNERTKLITPPLNLLGGASIELSFYLCQIPWYFEGSTGWDVLRVYYKVSESSQWVLLHEYLDPIYEWELQKLVLPNPSSTYYIAFEGHTRWGYGTCIDNITIESKGFQQMWIKDIDFQQPFSSFLPSGSSDIPVMRIDFTVYGNTGSAILDNMSFTSLNTSDSDLQSNGVKLYSTINQTYTTENLLGSPTNFVSGIADFTNLNHILPPGHSYLWLTYDVKADVDYGNILDVKVAANSIFANDTLYPSVEQSPEGQKIVYSTQYYENFEAVHNWTLTGEFEVNTPTGSGGLPGNPDPSSAFSGSKILGTDLTGLGSFPYNYEPGLSEMTSYRATSPSVNLFYYKNLNLFFQRYLNIEVWDSSYIQVSIDNGSTWNTIWNNHNSWVSDFQWTQQQIQIPDEFSRTNQLQVRFQLGPTDIEDNYSGWNIDDVYITGEFITKDVGVSEWIYPLSGSGHSLNDSVTVRISNYGGAEIVDPVPVAYSFNGGQTWTVDYMTDHIPIGGSVIFTFPTKADLSEPGLRSSVLAETQLPGDQYPGNNRFYTQIYIIPTYSVPYFQDFEQDDGFWRTMGNEIWEYGTPGGSVINTASSGIKSWVTGLNHDYGDLISLRNKIIFEDKFESDLGWTFSGEFERNIPDYGNLPYFATSGYYCIGTDLSGQGTFPFNYENGINSSTAFNAVSPSFDVRNYSNLRVGFSAWITISQGDSVKFEASPDNGIKWYTIWKNSEGAIFDPDFEYREFLIPDSLSDSGELRFRFSLYHTSSSGPVAQGWSIDDFLLTGDLVDTDEGYLTSPSFDLTSLSNPVFETRLWLDTEPDIDGATLYYSLDDGYGWTPVSNASGFDSYWNWYIDKPVMALGMNGWSGQSNRWITARHLLPSVLTGQKNVQFRIKFMADKSNNLFNGIGIDDIRIIEAPGDAGVLEILSPVTACELGYDERFTIRVKNYGIRNMEAGDSIKIGYYIEKSGEIQIAEETIYLTQSFSAGTTRDFIMEERFDFSTPGEYRTSVFTIENDPFFYNEFSNDTINRLIRVNKPFVELGNDISTIRPDTVILKAFSGIEGYDYLWNDGSTDSVYHVNNQGTYFVRVTNDIGCVASDTVNVTQLISDMGVSELISPASACELGSKAPLEIKIKNLGTDIAAVNDTVFIFAQVNTLLLKDTLVLNVPLLPDSTRYHIFSQDFDFSAPGIYKMKLYTRFRDDFRTNDTLKYDLEVFGYPLVDLGPDTVLMAPQYKLTATPGYATYLWQDGSDQNTFVVDEPGEGFYYVTVGNIHNCTTTDSVKVILNMTDIGIDRILSPETSCGLSENITVSVRVRNTGNQVITSGQKIKLGYLVNGSSLKQDSVQLSNNMLPGETLDFTFSEMVQVITGQWYDFTLFVNYNSDMKLSNDTIIMPVGIFESPEVSLGDDYKVVTALQYVLDAGPGYVSYLWHDGSPGQTFTVDIPGINKCSVTVADLNGCTAYDEIEIMLAVPDIGITEIIHPKSSCSLGSDEHIQVAVKNLGNWDLDQSSIIAVNYSVNGMPPVTEIITLNSTFENGSVIWHTFTQGYNFSIPGTYEISASTIYGADQIPLNDKLTEVINILQRPVVNIGDGQDTILVHEPITLYANTGYSSYKWQDGSTDTYYEIASPGAGMYSVLVTGSNGCSTLDSVFVAYDVPDIGITRIVTPVSSCKPESNNPVSLEVQNNGFYRIPAGETLSIHYSVNNGSVVNEEVTLGSSLYPGQKRIISFTGGYDFSLPGNYQLDAGLNYISDENPLNNTISSLVSVWGFPEVEIGGGLDTIKTVRLPITLDAGTGYTSWTWQDNSTGPTYMVTEWNLYWVTVTDEHGCSARDSVYVYSPFSVDDTDIIPENLKIYPNPAGESLHIKMDMGMPVDVRLELFNYLSTPVFIKDYNNVLLIKDEIDVHELIPGLYMLKITADKVSRTYKVIVK